MTRDGEHLAELAERPVERRLRQALDARAESIDVRRLRPADPPGAENRPRRAGAPRGVARPRGGPGPGAPARLPGQGLA
ncbi:hypothetical protein ACFVZ8_11345, partial [Streptomyces sp. NPDC059558]